MTGNKYEREDDMPALPGVLGLEIVRHYNSENSRPEKQNGSMGRGWRLSYETELYDFYGKVQVLQADGGRVIFDRDPKNPSLCSTPNPANGSMAIVQQANGPVEYVWSWTNGRKLYFNNAGKLYRIKALTGEFVSLEYDQRNVLRRVTDPQGRSLDLVYFDPKMKNHFRGVQYIDSPVGRFEYEYGSALPKGSSNAFDKRYLLALMVKVKLPTRFAPYEPAHALTSRGTTTSQLSRIYHHEDAKSPWVLTGISVETLGPDKKPLVSRYSTFGYDHDARAILSTHADGVDKVTLDTREGGKTVLTNSLGQKTVYLHTVLAGEHRLLDVRGAGCATCGETNVRYGYNAAGQLTETIKLSDDGKPVSATRTDFDPLGRATRIGRVLYAQGKPQPVQWLTRIEYPGASFAPSVIARPSVVAGKEASTRIVYNTVGQPLSVTQSGWAPAFDGALAEAQIERTTRYRYAKINDASSLIEIDGPLPNGATNTPLDSDITVIEYDNRSNSWAPPKPLHKGGLEEFDPSVQRRGVISSITTPGYRKSTVQFDRAGRVSLVTDPDGHATNMQYSPRGQLLSFTRDGVIYSTLYDGFDNPVESGYTRDGHYQALERRSYDGAGRNIWTASQLGILDTKRYDTEGQLLEKATVSNTIKQTQRYEYDRLARLQTVSDASGGTRRIGWNALGLPDELTDALGRTTRFGYDGMGNITSVVEAANLLRSRSQITETRFEVDVHGRPVAVIAPNGAATRYIIDDFGQTLATIGADSGKTTRRFDAAGRLIASSDANGNAANYAYDVMGRIVSQSVTDASNGGKKTVTTWRYEGARLVAIDHPDQAERYGYDEQGRLTHKTVIIAQTGGGQVSNTTRYHYDAIGQLTGVSLPDGSMLDYQRNGQNQITSLERNLGSGSWVRWLLPQQTIVKNIERDVVGLKHLTFGNGIEAYYQRSKEGNLARIVYNAPRLLSRDTRSAALETVLGIGTATAAPTPPTALLADRPALLGALGLPLDQSALIDHRYLWDVQGNLLYKQDKGSASSYAFDARDRLIAAATSATPTTVQTTDGKSRIAALTRYHYDNNGNRLLAQEGVVDENDRRSNTLKTVYRAEGDRWDATTSADSSTAARYDATGQPDSIGNRTFVWDAMGRLLEVRDGNRTVALYRYNHRGERIEKTVGGEHTYYLYEDRKLVAELDAKGAIRREYVYLADQPVAVIDGPAAGAADGKHNTALNRLGADLGILWHSWFGKAETTAFLQNNHLGAPEMATDVEGRVVWQANYKPFGELLAVVARTGPPAGGAGFALNLRLPGQYEDTETGLYYNDHRYYDPARGRYLTLDPLGRRGGANSYAYANGNPLKYVDPSGLVLFAFDGSGNDLHDKNLYTNVVKFADLYQDKAYYITGVGTKDDETGIAPDAGDPGGKFDIINAYTGKLRITAMIKRLNDYSDAAVDDTVFNIDIVGFSRGAAEGRDFANQIAANFKDGYYHYTNGQGKAACQKVALNFMGLFDSVLSKHKGDYQLGIPDAFHSVVQAMALNEYRGGAINFPMESILGAPTPANATRLERGFLGAHSDIGGGYPDNALSAVALAWMVDQAKLAGVQMLDKSSLHTVIANPVFHDASSNLLKGAETGGPTPTSEDRDVRYRNGTVEKQRKTTLSVMSYADTLQFIKYKSNPNSNDNIAGTVDMKGYLQWLNNHGYKIDMTTP